LAGVDGTTTRLKERNPQSPVIGRAWLKTGSLRDVASVAGYVQGESGQRYSVVAVINHPNANLARPALDALLEWSVRDGPKTKPKAQRKPQPGAAKAQVQRE
jgi:D-alanyl-D-alanine carboxypeptidase/D-alanyl-D-alanine-endopeptidase (penicillin-binding protein 4)